MLTLSQPIRGCRCPEGPAAAVPSLRDYRICNTDNDLSMFGKSCFRRDSHHRQDDHGGEPLPALSAAGADAESAALDAEFDGLVASLAPECFGADFALVLALAFAFDFDDALLDAFFELASPFGRNQLDGGGIDAEAQAGRRRTIVEDMSEMGAAAAAHDLDPRLGFACSPRRSEWLCC